MDDKKNGTHEGFSVVVTSTVCVGVLRYELW